MQKQCPRICLSTHRNYRGQRPKDSYAQLEMATTARDGSRGLRFGLTQGKRQHAKIQCLAPQWRQPQNAGAALPRSHPPSGARAKRRLAIFSQQANFCCSHRTPVGSSFARRKTFRLTPHESAWVGFWKVRWAAVSERGKKSSDFQCAFDFRRLNTVTPNSTMAPATIPTMASMTNGARVPSTAPMPLTSLAHWVAMSTG